MAARSWKLDAIFRCQLHCRGRNSRGLKAELEIRHLHEKINHILMRQWERLAEIQQIQLEMMQDPVVRKR